jgi:hypothetical protein
MSEKPDLARLRRLFTDLQTEVDQANVGGVLGPLLEALEREVERLQQELDALYEDQFVGTTEGRTLPYFAAGVVIGSVAVASYVCRRG